MNDQLKTLFDFNRDKLDVEIPDPLLFSRIMIKHEQKKRKKIIIKYVSFVSLSGVAAIFLTGFFMGWFEFAGDKMLTQPLVEVKSKNQLPVQQNFGPKKDELNVTAISITKHAMDNKNAVSTSLHQNYVFQTAASPAKRLSAIYEIDHDRKVDKKIFVALFQVLNKDPNTNVRLAALDVIMQYINQPKVRERVVYALMEQDDPFVQILLIQLVADFKGKSVATTLKKIIENPETNEDVREEARFASVQLYR